MNPLLYQDSFQWSPKVTTRLHEERHPGKLQDSNIQASSRLAVVVIEISSFQNLEDDVRTLFDTRRETLQTARSSFGQLVRLTLFGVCQKRDVVEMYSFLTMRHPLSAITVHNAEPARITRSIEVLELRILALDTLLDTLRVNEKSMKRQLILERRKVLKKSLKALRKRQAFEARHFECGYVPDPPQADQRTPTRKGHAPMSR